MSPHLPNEIVPGVWMGDRHVRIDPTCETFMNSFVTHVVDASNKKMPTLTIPVFRVPMPDVADSTLPFDQVSAFIDTALIKFSDAIVLVHCIEGRSRSAALVMGYLIQIKGFTLKQAFFLLKKRRRMVLPNAGFMKQLIEIERQVHNGNTTLKLGFGGTFLWKKDKDMGRAADKEATLG
jgi:atypical dual specificity phosphatase